MKGWHNGSMRLLVTMVCVVVFVCVGMDNARAEAFRNLDFESAVIGTPVNYEVPASQALPSWTCNSWDPGYVAYGTIALDAPCISIHDGHSGYLGDFNPLQGQYSIMLQDGADAFGHTFDAWISQTGDVPINAKSLMFESDISTYVNELQVSINAVVIPFALYSVDGTVNSSFGPVKTYICDISSFAGETDAVLEFDKLVHDTTHPYNHGMVDLDAIRFSSIVAPEPSSLVLLVIGILSLAGYCWRRR